MPITSRLPLPTRIGRTVTAALIVTATVLLLSPPAQAATAGDLEACFLSEINSARAGGGAPPLSRDSALSSYGRAHSTKMADSGGIYHSSSAALQPHLPDGWRSWGENVGMASDSSSCGALFDGFWNSSGHRKNLMDPAFDIAGIGVILTDDGTMWTTHVFVDVGSAPATTTTSTTTTTTTTIVATTTSAAPTSTTASATTTEPPTTATTSPTTSAPTPVETIEATTSTAAAITSTTTTGAIESSDPYTAALSPPSDPTTSMADPEAAAEDEGPALVASTCTGPACDPATQTMGLLALAGVVGGVLAYRARRP